MDQVIEQLKKIAKLNLPSEGEREIEEVLAECFDMYEIFTVGQTEGQVNLARNILTKLGVDY